VMLLSIKIRSLWVAWLAVRSSLDRSFVAGDNILPPANVIVVDLQRPAHPAATPTALRSHRTAPWDRLVRRHDRRIGCPIQERGQLCEVP